MALYEFLGVDWQYPISEETLKKIQLEAYVKAALARIDLLEARVTKLEEEGDHK